MSYSRSYSTVISGTAHGSVHYPKSDTGGSVPVSLSWSEPVYVNIHVDTSSFDHGVDNLKGHLNVLTGAVVTTEAAQIAEKTRASAAISQSVTAGFFTLIRSELTQQIAALRSRVDSFFLKLNQMKDACLRIQQTMQQDFARITDRYSSLFADLDRELATRVAALDESVYNLFPKITAQHRRSIDSTLSTVPTVFAEENARVQSIVQAGTLRGRMNDLLQDAVAYLVAEKNFSRDLQAILFPDSAANGALCIVPVLYLKADNANPAAQEQIFLADLPGGVEQRSGFEEGVMGSFRDRSLPWKTQSADSRAQIERFLIPLMDSIQTQAPEHDNRVRQKILQLWNAHAPQTLPL
jgi:hypothetical protein